MTFRPGHARVLVTVNVVVECEPWGADCTIAQAVEQATKESEQKLRRMLAEAASIQVLGATTSRVVLDALDLNRSGGAHPPVAERTVPKIDYSQEALDDLQRRVPLREMVAGKRCPACGMSGVIVLDTDKGPAWSCLFGRCGMSGKGAGAIRWVMEAEDVSQAEAIRRLRARYPGASS